jgi:ubiquinone/menaquinone biosynthesis C-methylase UbiE
MSFKTELISIIRQAGLSKVADQARYQWMRFKNHQSNSAFRKEFPGVALPPPYMVYESFQIDYRKYFLGGREDAEWIASLAKPHCHLENAKILDWGCGPARIIRHMPDILGKTSAYFGTDYNADTIAWCMVNIPGINFSKNNLTPPLPYPDNQFDLVYGISILTHLSEENQFAWSNELYRVTSPNGIVILTTHGDAFLEKLTETEVEAYHHQKVIQRDKTKEGHRTFGTFHPPAFMRNVFERSGFQITQHIAGRRVNESYISQDMWILKKA